MPNPIFEKSFHIRSYEVDFAGRVRASALLNYLQEAAGDHARILGVAVRDLMPFGLTWVLSRTHLACTGILHARDKILIRTWPSAREGRFTCREFQIFGPQGEQVAAATCSFAVLDLETRRPIVIGNRLPEYPLLKERALDDPFSTLPRLESPQYEAAFSVRSGDLDLNGHANNVAYANWALETIPLGVMKSCRLVDLEIAYRAEVFHGETVMSLSREITGGIAPVFHHLLVRKEDGAELTRLVSRWECVTEVV